MARPEKTILPPAESELSDERLEAASQAAQELHLIKTQMHDNATKLARELNYEGPLTIGAVEDGIRVYQRRTVEDCLGLGKHLLLLKELTPHGEFQQRVEMLGIDSSLGRKLMSATLKFSKRETNPVLIAAQSQSKLLELIVFDDGEIESLENGESVRGIKLDDIEMMSVSELKKALRKQREEVTQLEDAKNGVIAEKTELLNTKIEELSALKLKHARLVHIDYPEAFGGYFAQMEQARRVVKHHLGTIEFIRAEAMKIEPEATPGAEQSLELARGMLATELVKLHNDFAEILEALGISFDKTLGNYTESRIRWIADITQ
jgi:hypothetical protein